MVSRAALLGFLLLAAAPGAGAQEILQAVVLELAVAEVHVIVARARGDEHVECLVRDRNGRVRVVGREATADGLTSGGTTILSIPLPLLDPRETEFAVALVRRDTELRRTEWRPIFRSPPRASP
ncbi:MAG: hypothetical protein ACREMB_16610 [Candidatus Rokuibacteriota bacterium]